MGSFLLIQSYLSYQNRNGPQQWQEMNTCCFPLYFYDGLFNYAKNRSLDQKLLISIFFPSQPGSLRIVLTARDQFNLRNSGNFLQIQAMGCLILRKMNIWQIIFISCLVLSRIAIINTGANDPLPSRFIKDVFRRSFQNIRHLSDYCIKVKLFPATSVALCWTIYRISFYVECKIRDVFREKLIRFS